MDMDRSGRMKYVTNSWDLVQALYSASAGSCKTPVGPIDSIPRNNQPRRNKKSWQKIKLPTIFMAFPWLTYTESRAVVGQPVVIFYYCRLWLLQ